MTQIKISFDINTKDLNNFICSCKCLICHELLLDSILAQDAVLYNKKCFISFINGKATVKSPIKGIIINNNYIENKSVREMIMFIIKNTSFLDAAISQMSSIYIFENKLVDFLIECSKLPDYYIKPDISINMLQ